MKKILIFALTLVFQYGLVAQPKPKPVVKKANTSQTAKKATTQTTQKVGTAPKPSPTSSSNEEYDITVVVKGLEKGKNAYLGYYFGDKQYLIDTVQVQDNGVVRFNRAKKLHGGMYLFVTHDIQYFEFIIDSVQKFTLKTDTSLGMVGNMQVFGSVDNERFFSYLKSMEQFRKDAEELKGKVEQGKGKEKESAQKQLDDLDGKIKSYQKNFKSARPGELFVKMLNGNEDVDMSGFPIKSDGSYDTLAQFYYYKSHYWDKVDFRDERLLYTPVYHKKMSRYFEDLVFQTPDSIIPETDWFIGEIGTQPDLFKYTVHFLTNKYEKSEIMGMDRVFVHLGKKYYLTGRATWMDETAMAKFKDRITTLEYNLIGINGMELNLPDSSEKLRSLYSVKAPITILVFWNPDCGHCQKEIPMLFKLWNGIKDNGVAVYAVNTEFDKNLWTKFIREKGLNGWTNVHDIKVTHNFRKWYDVYSTPVVYLMDADKKILAKRIAADQIEGYLKNYYSKELKKTWKDSGIDPKTLKTEGGDH